MIIIKSNGNNSNSGVKEYILDTPDDIINLPKTDTMGSSAFVISTSEVYMLNSLGEWVKL